MKKILKERGITLIALVITIIILLILAGVTLRYVFLGGIIDNSQRATNTYMGQYNNEINDVNNLSNLIGNYINDSNNPDNPDNPDDDQPATGDETDYTGESKVPNILPDNPTDDDIEKFKEKVVEVYPELAPSTNNIVPVYDRKDLEEVGCGNMHMVNRIHNAFPYTTDAIYILMDDIDLSDNEWKPISTVLTTAFIGNNHKISNMTITGEQTTKDVGLFAVSSAKIENLIMENVNISNITFSQDATSVVDSNITPSNIGTIVGCFIKNREIYSDNSILKNCIVLSGNIKSPSNAYSGGLVGYYIDNVNYSNVPLKNIKIELCTNKANCTNTNFGGILGGTNYKIDIESCTNSSTSSCTSGIIGKVTNTTMTIYNCINNAQITKAGIINEIDGENSIITIKRCYNYAETTSASDSNKGGIIGIIKKGKVDVINCYNSGSIRGSNNTGGIIGQIDNAKEVNLIKSENIGNNSGENQTGGIIGLVYEGTSGNKLNIKECKNSGNISGIHDIGGIIGGNFIEELNMDNCENSGNITGQNSIGGLIGCVTRAGKVNITLCKNNINGTINGLNYFGGIIGNSDTKNVNISNSTNYAEIKSLSSSINSSNEVGGIVGCITSGTYIIQDCENYGRIDTNCTDTGGIIGYASSCSMNIIKCNNHELIKGNKCVGGIIGYLGVGNNSNIQECKNDKEVEAIDRSAGGIIGEMQASNAIVKVEKCENIGDISIGGWYVGGIIGYLSITNSESKIVQCNNKGNITAGNPDDTDNGTKLGGICGFSYYETTFEKCTNSGTLTSYCILPTIGGIVGAQKMNDIGCSNSGAIVHPNDTWGQECNDIIGYVSQ